MVKIAVPVTLKRRCMILARLALTEVPIDDKSAVTQEPIFEPKIINNTALPPPPISKPWLAIAIIIVVTADEDCKSAVNTIPKISNKKGLLRDVNKSCTAGEDL